MSAASYGMLLLPPAKAMARLGCRGLPCASRIATWLLMVVRLSAEDEAGRAARLGSMPSACCSWRMNAVSIGSSASCQVTDFIPSACA